MSKLFLERWGRADWPSNEPTEGVFLYYFRDSVPGFLQPIEHSPHKRVHTWSALSSLGYQLVALGPRGPTLEPWGVEKTWGDALEAAELAHEVLKQCGKAECKAPPFYVDADGVAWCLPHRGDGLFPSPEEVIEMVEGPDSLSAAVEEAAEHLPEGFEILIRVERGAGWVELFDPEDEETIQFNDSDENMGALVRSALAAAKELED